MLQQIRDRAHGFVAWVIVILISIPFALWGIQEYLGQDPNVPVANVNGEEIPLAEFQLAYQRQRANIQSLLGASQDLGLLDESRLKNQTLERLVAEEILVQSGYSDGLRVSDEQLARQIRQQQAFHAEGSFSQDAYTSWLYQQGLSPGRFEHLLRRSMVTSQIETGIAGTAIATSYDAERMLRLLGQRRAFARLVVSPERFLGSDVDDDEVARFYEDNKASFVSPEQVTVKYIVLSRSDLGNEIEATDDDLRELYETYKANYAVPEQRKARHILVEVGEERDDESARELAEELRGRLEAGEPFDAVAREHSDDPGSAQRGGDLGFFGRGIMDPEFDAAAFSLDVGKVSEPVRSRFGYHIIEVEEIRAGETKSFEAVREELLETFRHEAAENLYFDQAEQLSRLTFEHPDTLEIAADTLGLEVQKSDFFSVEGIPDDPILGDPAVIGAAFGEEVREGNNSEAIELESDQVVVLRVDERREAKQLELDAVRDEIVERLRERASREKARLEGAELLRRLRAGEPPEAVAAGAGLEWTDETTATRVESDGDPAVLRTVFRMKRPSADRPSFDGAITGAGEFVVIRLESVTDDPDPESGGPSRQAAQQSVARDSGTADFDSYRQALRAEADVELHQDRL